MASSRPPPPEPPPHRVRAADLYPRLRTTRDEPGLDVPFSPICGEFVQWVGRTMDGGVLAMSNYRLHAQARRRRGAGIGVPLGLLDSAEVRDLTHLLVYCKDGRILKCSFNSGEQCAEWWRRVTTAMAPASSVQDTFAAAYAAWARELPPASAPRALLRTQPSTQRHWFASEVERLGFTSKGAWRVTAANAEYKLCPSYPPLLVVPAAIGDEDLDFVARFRAMRRVPAVVWRHRGNGAVIARSSQPEVGWLGWRSSEDERLLAAFVSACGLDRGIQPPTTNKQTKLLIVDARSYASAVTNRARGGGCECAQYYPGADIQFMSMPNIHHVRRAFQQLRQLAAEPPDQPNWHSNLERTLWLQYVSGVGRAASLVARAVLAGRPVLVHCSDGWDRTPQIVAAAQLLLDPYYRSREGFRVMIEREWLDFGHKFADRCGHTFGPEDPNERSPIFLQWLDLVHQIMLQYPCSFEFSDAYLIKLVTHAHSCMFGTFLCNTAKERAEARVAETTAHVWKLLEGPAYRNHLYVPPAGEQVLWPDFNVRSLSFWSSLYVGGRADVEEDADMDVEPPAPQPQHQPLVQHNVGVMSKTRSCDNLLNEVEKRSSQRRCSDPSLAADVVKLTSMLDTSGSVVSLNKSPPIQERVLTESLADVSERVASDDMSDRTDISTSCSDSLPNTLDQVDGIHIHHFENGDARTETPLVRDMTSNSSSLERELAPPGLPETVVQPPPAALAPPSPEEPSVFFDNYGDVVNMTEMARETSRMRHISITWRSVSESSHHTDSSAGFDITEVAPRNRNDSTNHSVPVEREISPLDNHNSTVGDLANHNVVRTNLTNHMRLRDSLETNGDVNHGSKIDDSAVKLLERELGNLATGSSSSVSSESDDEGAGTEGEAPTRLAAPCGSQQTLCPNSPGLRVGTAQSLCPACCHCCRRASSVGVESSTDSLGGGEQCCCGPGSSAGGPGAARCVCGAGGGAPARDPIDGLPPATSPVQSRLHQIILHQKMMVEELSSQLRSARAALRARVTSPTPPRSTPPPHASCAPAQTAMNSSQATSSGSEVEVEVGEEACGEALGNSGGVVWLPDSAVPRCQYCRNHFWLARRRHHCRKCGGIFCGSCSEVGGDWPQRVCRLCRSHR